MRRREFIQTSLLASVAAGLGNSLPAYALSDNCPVTDLPRSLVNVMLKGGADLRFLFMPSPSHPDSTYVNMLWSARRVLYDSAYNNYQEMFENEYLPTVDQGSGFEFGIFKRCGWLQSEFEGGRVAVIANAYCSRNRRHDQSILNADAGIPGLSQLNYDRNGWGGRLVEQVEDLPNVVELGQSISVFSKGSTPGARFSQVVHAEDTRDMALTGVDPERPAGSRRNVLARALSAWYDARGPEVVQEQSSDWPYHTFFKHREALQTFGLSVQQRLDACGDLPEALQTLAISNGDFTQQCKNLYDACQLSDVLKLRAMSMNFGGWDTHNNEYAEIGANLDGLFGAGGGLATTLPLIGSLPYLDHPALDNLVFYFASDFGRQLRANGSGGTDHGRGTYSLLIGNAVRGGVYGNMFPAQEVNPNSEGLIPMQAQGADIEGKTSTERILARACDWVEPGTSPATFPNATIANIESPGMLDDLIIS